MAEDQTEQGYIPKIKIKEPKIGSRTPKRVILGGENSSGEREERGRALINSNPVQRTRIKDEEDAPSLIKIAPQTKKPAS